MLVICNPNERFNIIMLNIETTKADIIFKPIPAFIISLISNCPLPKITALEPVFTLPEYEKWVSDSTT